MKKIILFLLCLIILPSCSNAASRQGNNKSDNTKSENAAKKNIVEFRVMSYNVENLFDTYDNQNINDNEFLPDGQRRWTNKRYYSHLRKTAQVVSAIGEWGAPAICGLCEVENDTVLYHLLNRTELKKYDYKYCITTGSDKRGINNALIYQRDKFKYLGHESVRIRFTNKHKRSRDILHVWGEIINGEKLDILVCHFPSRSSGEKETERDRLDAAQAVLNICNFIYKKNDKPNIIIMGDFNDTPSDKSIQKIIANTDQKEKLINLFGDDKKLNFGGSHSYQGEWSQLDQMIVSPHWNNYLKKNSPRIFAEDFLLTKKNRQGIQRPRRVYSGFNYEDGYSDHLPIVADFEIKY